MLSSPTGSTNLSRLDWGAVSVAKPPHYSAQVAGQATIARDVINAPSRPAIPGNGRTEETGPLGACPSGRPSRRGWVDIFPPLARTSVDR